MNALRAQCYTCSSLLKTTFSARRLLTTPAKAPRDGQITASQVRFVNAEGQFQGVMPLSQVRRAYDPNTHALLNLTPAQAIPTCRLFALDALREAETKAYAQKRAKKGSANPAQTTKEVVLNWNVTDHDLEHKIEAGLQALRKGNKVDVSVGMKRKRGMILPPVPQRSTLLDKIKALLEEHGKERKAAEGNVNTGVVLRYQGHAPTASQTP